MFHFSIQFRLFMHTPFCLYVLGVFQSTMIVFFELIFRLAPIFEQLSIHMGSNVNTYFQNRVFSYLTHAHEYYRSQTVLVMSFYILALIFIEKSTHFGRFLQNVALRELQTGLNR